MRATASERPVSMPELLRTATYDQIINSIGKFIGDKVLYSPDTSHEQASHPTYLESSRLLRNEIAVPRFANLSKMPRQKVKILEKFEFFIGRFLSARLTMPGKKSNKEMKIDWGSTLGALVLSSTSLESQEIWNGTERYVGIILDRPIVEEVGILDAKV